MPTANESLLKEELREGVASEYTENLSVFSPFRVDADKLSGNEAIWQDFLIKVNASLKKVQNILIDVETIDFLAGITEEFGFSEGQSKELTRTVRDILLADIFLGDFPALISQKLNIETETTNQIVQKIIGELFAPAIEDIKNIQREKFGDRIAQARSDQPQQIPPAPVQPRRPVGFIRPDERVQEGNVVDLRNRENQS